MSTSAKTFLTPEQYLEIEERAEFKSEYFDGQMFAMSGATRPHIVVAGNLLSDLHGQLRQSPCEVYQSDMRVRVDATGLYTYPDLVVVCGPQFLNAKQNTLLNPVLIVEILSPSTEAYDRGFKFKHYRSIESLQVYMLVSTETVDVDVRRRQPDGKWTIELADKLEDVIELPSIGCRLTLADIYERVNPQPTGTASEQTRSDSSAS